MFQSCPGSEFSSSVCRFEWVDGALTRAVEHGGWVLLRGANLAAPAVLDRLNALLEPGGTLVLNEAGSPGGGGPRVVRPHPDFRLILALDPRCGCICKTRACVEGFQMLRKAAAAAAFWLHAVQARPESSNACCDCD